MLEPVGARPDATRPEPDAMEAAYRRGYRQGFAAALRAVEHGRLPHPARLRHLWAFYDRHLLPWSWRSRPAWELPPEPEEVTPVG